MQHGLREIRPLMRHVAVILGITTMLGVGLIAGLAASGANARSTGQSPDLNGDGVVDQADQAILLSYYGQAASSSPGAARADLNDDGVVDATDLSILLSAENAGTTPPTTPTSGNTTTAPPPPPPNDDINRDGLVDGNDLDVLKSYLGKPLDTAQAHNADLNGNGVVDIVDLSIFLSNLPPGTTLPTSTTTTPQPPTEVHVTYSESEWARSGVRTFTNYHNASGVGPLIAYRQIVEVSCKVKDGTIKSVNPDGYWYRIASAPWGNNYYAPANVFLNGDPPNGPYSRNTDFAVPDCGSTTSPPIVTPRPTSPAPLPTNAPRHLWIIALGDSYTAGNGAGANYDSCHRSYNSYAWLYMNRLRNAGINADIWQRACSGNVTTDVPGQLADVVNNSPVKHSADIVFMTIGGNDLHFTDIVADCLFNRGAAVAGCSSRLDHALNSIDSVIQRTKNQLQQIASQMPHAQVVLIGYPALTSPRCPFTKWNEILAEAQEAYDTDQSTMVKQLSRSNSRFHFISIAGLFGGHGPCASSSAQYVRGVDARLGFSWWGSYHPNATGNQVIANLLYARGVQNW